MRAAVIGLFLSAVLGAILSAQAAQAYDAYDPANCNGIDWDDQRTLVVSKVTAQPRAHFIKSPYDDDFKAATCPAATDACRKKSFLVTGDLVLVGKTRGEFTCVLYQSPAAKKPTWSKGWLPSIALTPIAPMTSPQMPDWTGKWSQPGGSITIKRGDGGKLRVEGEMTYRGAQNVQTGEIEAQVTPKGSVVAFVDDGTIPFEKTDAGECRVRMQRIGPWLVVEDNSGCGGVAATFTGFYRRAKG
jgi:hypothetical protein